MLSREKKKIEVVRLYLPIFFIFREAVLANYFNRCGPWGRSALHQRPPGSPAPAGVCAPALSGAEKLEGSAPDTMTAKTQRGVSSCFPAARGRAGGQRFPATAPSRRLPASPHPREALTPATCGLCAWRMLASRREWRLLLGHLHRREHLRVAGDRSAVLRPGASTARPGFAGQHQEAGPRQGQARRPREFGTLRRGQWRAWWSVAGRGPRHFLWAPGARPLGRPLCRRRPGYGRG